MAITLSFLALMVSLVALRAVSQSNQLHKALMRSEGEREQLELTICSLIDGDGEVVKLALPPSAVRTTHAVSATDLRYLPTARSKDGRFTRGSSFQRPPMPPEGTFDCPLESERRKQARDKAQRHRGGKLH